MILVTGSGGNIGAFVTDDLMGSGYRVRSLDRRPPASAHETIQGDLRDPEVCRRAVEGVRAVVHLAAYPNDHQSDTYENNLQSTRELARAAHAQQVPRFLFGSSICVYGDSVFKRSNRVFTPARVPIDTSVANHPEDAYGRSKQACESCLRELSELGGTAFYCFRMPTIWFPEKTNGHRPGWRGWRLRARDPLGPWIYLDVRDFCRALKLALEREKLPAFGCSYLSAKDTVHPWPSLLALGLFVREFTIGALCRAATLRESEGGPAKWRNIRIH